MYDLGTWLLDFLKTVWTDFWNFILDAVINIFDLLSQAVIAVVGAIPLPSSLGGGIASLWANVDPGIRFLADSCGIIPALGMIGAGFGFRLLRKALTLFQW